MALNGILITGASGTLGACLARMALAAGWAVTGTFRRRPLPLPVVWHQLDVADRAATLALIEREAPAAIVHTAFSSGPDLWAATAEGAATVALGAARIGARLVHLSSDALFDGTGGPYREEHAPSPITPYGAAKAAAETAVAAVSPDSTIVRTSLIIARDPIDRHSRAALDLAQGRGEGALFTDEYRCPVAVEDLATAVLELVSRPYAGILHLAGPEPLSRHAMGCLIAEAHGMPASAVPAGTLAASGLRRPADVRLDSGRARTILRARPRRMRDYLGLA